MARILAERFADRNYIIIDCLRRKFWKNPAVAWFYAQNMFLYVHAKSVANYPSLNTLPGGGSEFPLDVVHPEQFFFMNKMNLSPGELFGITRRLFQKAIEKRAKKIQGSEKLR